MAHPRLVDGLVFLTLTAAFGAGLTAQEAPKTGATFKSGVEVVTLTTVVRNREGRLVTNLRAEDFEVRDGGQPRPIIAFRSEPTPISVALLFDVSGSMDVAAKLTRARDAAHQVLSWLDLPGDEAALFAFDSELHQLRSFQKPSTELKEALAKLEAFGETSLHDAIAAAAERVLTRNAYRRAIVVLTDGIDTSSRLSPAQVSAAASAIDVPVYILVTVPRIDHPGEHFAVPGALQNAEGELSDLSRWTGGALFVASLPSHVSLAARQIVTELRQQYLIAVEPSTKPGWHPLEVRTRDKRLNVRTRSGYVVGPDVTNQ
jgi:VWFA-related protein